MEGLFRNLFDINGDGQMNAGERMMDYALFQHMADAENDDNGEVRLDDDTLDSNNADELDGFDDRDDLEELDGLDERLEEILIDLDGERVEPLGEIHCKIDGFEF